MLYVPWSLVHTERLFVWGRLSCQVLEIEHGGDACVMTIVMVDYDEDEHGHIYCHYYDNNDIGG